MASRFYNHYRMETFLGCLRLFFGLFIFTFLLSFGAFAQNNSEEILLFHTEIDIRKNSEVYITETIEVRALHQNINRGIYRTIPVVGRGSFMTSSRIDLEVLGLKRNGNPEPYFIEQNYGNVIINFGDNSFLDKGEHSYELSYKLNRVLRFFYDYDEIYWNVTGNDWSFRILESSANIKLPKGASMNSQACYTGAGGSRATNCVFEETDSGTFLFKSNDILNAGEGITVAISWPKGFTAEPTDKEKRQFMYQDNKGAFAGISGFIIILLYYFFTWSRVGKDPAKGTIIPMYIVPDELSPAAMRYILRMGFDSKAFSASVVSLATKGALTIEEVKKEFSLKKTGSVPDNLTTEERQLYYGLFSRKSIVKVDRANYEIFSSSKRTLDTTLKKAYQKNYFNLNTNEVMIGALLSVFAILSIFLTSDSSDEVAYFLGIWLSIWTVGCSALVFAVFTQWKSVRKSKSNIPQAGCISLFSIPFITAEIVVLIILGLQIGFLSVILILMIFLLNILFFPLMKAPTIEGRSLMDKIEGFKLYLSVAEGSRIGLMGAPEKNFGLYEIFLPYAIALDVENEWSQQFSSLIEQASISESLGRKGYSPGWYHGSQSFSTIGTNSLASSLGTAFSSAVSSSSSGSGGGGSSGGGSGGGGGGGR
jgi:hypothetical protein